MIIPNPTPRGRGAVLRTLLLGACLSLAVHAADEPRRNYNLPSGDAAALLRKFADESGREVLFAADAVRGVRTKEVKGELTTQEALNQMLAGTGLTAVADEKSGAYAIRASAPPRKAETEDAPRRSTLEITEREMRVAAAAAPKRDRESDIFELSPFEVNTDKDDGFMATNAGTATKLGIDLKDLAAPYSVMTGEFIKAMGIVDLREAAIWSTNGAPVLDGGNPDGIGAPTMYFNRGAVLNQGQQRNFFLNAGIGDTYNVDRIDFGRGPNAVLFSVGSNNVLGGGISSQGKRARFDRDEETIAVTVGSWDYYRSTIDVNRVLTDKLAVRANAMLQKKNGWLQQEFDDRYGITVTGSYRISPKTELRIEGVMDKVERTQPAIPYLDFLSGWNGSTVFDGRITNAMLSTTATPGSTYGLTFNGEPQGVFREGGNRYVYDPVTGTVVNWIHTGYSRPGDDTNRTPVYFNDVPISRQGNNDNPGFGTRGYSFYESLNLPEDRFSRQIANSNFQVPGKRFSNMPNAPIFTQRMRDINLGFTHQFSDSLFFELHADYNRVDQHAIASYYFFRNVFIDLNRNLPNGQPNPHFKDAFGEAPDMTRNTWKTDNAGVRAYLGYIKDLGKWGHYTFNLSLAGNERVVDFRNRAFSMALATDPREWHAGSQRIRLRYYLGDSYRPFYEVAPDSVFDVTPVNGGNDGYTTTTKNIQPRWVLGDWNHREEQTKSAILAFAARYFDNKLIISPGVRVDQQESYFRLKPTSWAFMPNDPNWDGVTLDDRYWRPDAPDDWKTLTYIPKNDDGSPRSTVPLPAWGNRPTLPGVNDTNPANPLYANDRFRGDYNAPRTKKTVLTSTMGLTYHAFDWMSVKLSYGDSYKPADVGRLTLTGDDADAEVGLAYEAGLTFSLFKNRLAITPRYYFNRMENILGNPGTTGPINNLMGVRAWNDSSPDGRNPFGYTNVIGGDYFAFKNTGYEVEAVGRITPGWRVSASYGTALYVEYDRWQSTRAYVLSRQDEMLDVLKAAGGTLDPSRKPNGVDVSRVVNDAPGYAIPDPAITDAMIVAAGGDVNRRKAAIDNYNLIWARYDEIETLADRIGLKRLTAKLFTDYTVQTGALKGFRVGLGAFYVNSDIAGYRGGDTIINPDFDSSMPVTVNNRPYKDDPTVDSNTPVWIKRPLEFRSQFGYSRKLRSGRELDFQLNIINILNRQQTFYQNSQIALRAPDGDYSRPDRVSVPSLVAAFQRPISFEFTTTLTF